MIKARNEGIPQADQLPDNQRTYRYDANGRLLWQRVNDLFGAPDYLVDYTGGHDDLASVREQIIGHLFGSPVPTAERTDGYDAAGNLLQYRVIKYGDNGYTNTFTNHLVRYEGYVIDRTDGQSTLYEDGSTTRQYDPYGNLVGITDAQGSANNRRYYNDATGQALMVRQGDKVQRQLIANGQVLGRYGTAPDPVKPKDDDAHPQFTTGADLNFTYQVVNDRHPGTQPSSYSVVAGDTLQGIARQVYGDAGYWYRIADANGLDASTALQPGQQLLLPGLTGTTYNRADSMRPYDASQIIGDTMPTMPPSPPDEGGCGVLGQIIVVIVAVVVTVFTGGIGGAMLGSIISQGVGIALGVQKAFSWGAVALAGVSAGIAGGLAGVNVTGNALADTVIRSAASNALTQSVAVATGLQDRFSWASVAAAGAGAGVGQVVGDALNSSNAFGDLGTVGSRLARGAVTSLAAGATTAVLRGGRVSTTQIMVDAFGQAIGSSIVETSWSGAARQSVSYSAEEQAQDFARESNRGGWTQTPEPNTDLGTGLDPNRNGSPELRYRGMTAADLRAQADEWTLARIKANALSNPPTQSSASGPTMRDFDPTGTWQPNAMPLDVPQADASKWFKEAKAWVNEKAESAWDSFQKTNPDDFAILSPKNASAAAQYWANRHIETGNALYAIPGSLAAAWAEHPDEVGMILSMGRSGKMAPEEISPSGMPMLGANGVRTASKTIWKGEGKERIDVENPNPGQRPGQLHYQDNVGNKYLYDPQANSFRDAPSSVNKLLEKQGFSQAIEKGMKRYLGEK